MPHFDLLELPYFRGISVDAVVSLVDLMEPRPFQQGADIMTEGDPAPSPLYIATNGRVVISKRGTQDQPRAIAELDSPTLFGEIELFCQIPAVATVRALTNVGTFVLNRSTFDRLFEAHRPRSIFLFSMWRVLHPSLAIADEMLAQVLTNEDLVNMRRAVFSRMTNWTSTTGVFKRTQ